MSLIYESLNKYQDLTLRAREATPKNPQFFYFVPGANLTPAIPTNAGIAEDPYQVQFGVPLAGIGNGSVVSSDKQIGTYIQDDWQVNDHLTLNLGVRWDYERMSSYLHYVTPDDVLAGLYAPYSGAPGAGTYADALLAGGINIKDYISDGHNRSAPNGEWQPRLGFSYDLNGDEEHVVFGGAGRSYDRDLYDFLQLEKTKGTYPQTKINFNVPGYSCVAGPTCVPWNPAYLTNPSSLLSLASGAALGAGREVDLLPNQLKVPYSDQFSLGMRNKVGEWNTSAAVSYVASKDGFFWVLGNRFPDGNYFKNGSGSPFGQPIPGLGGLILGGNGQETRNTSLLLSADKPYTKDSGWGVTLAYTFSHARENRFFGKGNQYSFDEEFMSQYPWVTASGLPKHRFVTSGQLNGPWDTLFSFRMILATVLPITGFYQNPEVGNPNTAPTVPYAFTPGGSRFLLGGKIWGQRAIDLGLNKDFYYHDYDLYARLDVFNIFNWRNWVQGAYSNNISGVNSPGQITYSITQTGDLLSPPRTLKLTAGLRF